MTCRNAFVFLSWKANKASMIYFLLLFLEISHLLNFNRLLASTSHVQFMIAGGQIQDLNEFQRVFESNEWKRARYLSAHGGFRGIERKCGIFLSGHIQDHLEEQERELEVWCSYLFCLPSCREQWPIWCHTRRRKPRVEVCSSCRIEYPMNRFQAIVQLPTTADRMTRRIGPLISLHLAFWRFRKTTDQTCLSLANVSDRPFRLLRVSTRHACARERRSDRTNPNVIVRPFESMTGVEELHFQDSTIPRSTRHNHNLRTIEETKIRHGQKNQELLWLEGQGKRDEQQCLVDSRYPCSRSPVSLADRTNVE